ncbi:16S rRNA (cytosine(967)-C(5))-methyltransferase RsmB [Aquibacillus koreensis]|uniref:16S rRNA (cytosine(967)-C(5))-methyltransferase n=1 Tax=Aquibacillus koreensis TaxID=279446 RepID=A0A9X3WKV3_9BACI|nr:16S rRNA (cytosine(967)-C(5))-methyltransferase RsmB [Aquibacillus koreensis]MCT2538017.1 16S rRNA (cytosine(967)-C(5))-methyltransferase RsmB [Aquibacillus koreensis]MDC3420540.1 16S rRNA (cytosine(967)-C(5))-methyltransferase RsmB [Aquibacillus koreensis]
MVNSKYMIRQTALEILVRIGEGGGFSHLLIDQALAKKELSIRDEALLTEIVYGTIQRKLTLDYYLSHYLNSKKKIEPWVKWLLYMSIYQKQFLDKVPDHAIIHESVEIAKVKGHKGISSLVNGILRSIQREGLPNVDQITNREERLSIETSHPLWLIKRWVKMYGYEVTEDMCQINLQHKSMSIRVQPLRISRENAMTQLNEDGYEVEASLFSSQGIIVRKGNILKSNLFKDGYVTVQDQSSMLVAEMLDLEPGMTVLDACSAPGGKATHIAEKMEDTGVVYAYDLHEKKAKLVTKKAMELNLTIIQANQADSRELDTYHEKDTFDRILLDAPCSGLGVLRGKPDIKYNKREEDIDKLASIQIKLLESVSSLLKKDGKIIYSTCTVDRHENDYVIEKFLSEHTEFEVDESFFKDLPGDMQHSIGSTQWGLQLFPQTYNTDGFFLTRLKKK